MQIELGDKVKDRITGFTGIVVATTKYLTGCDRVQVQAQEITKDGKTPEWQSFDVTMVEVLEKKTIQLPAQYESQEVAPPAVETPADLPKKKGGPQPLPEQW